MSIHSINSLQNFKYLIKTILWKARRVVPAELSQHIPECTAIIDTDHLGSMITHKMSPSICHCMINNYANFFFKGNKGMQSFTGKKPGF